MGAPYSLDLRTRDGRRDLLKAIPLLMSPSLARADTLPLRFIPNANLTALDPIWTTALVAQAHGYLVYDQRYGIRYCRPPPQSRCARRRTGLAPVVLLSASDRPAYSQVSFVARDLFQKLGLTVDFQAMDWATVVTNQSAPDRQGRLSAFITALDGVTVSHHGGNFALRGSGQKAWFGWPTDEKLEPLRDAWLDDPDLPSQKPIAEQIPALGPGNSALHPAWPNRSADRVPLGHQRHREINVPAVLGRTPGVATFWFGPARLPATTILSPRSAFERRRGGLERPSWARSSDDWPTGGVHRTNAAFGSA